MKYGLTIGVDRYNRPGNDLAGCVNDARDWATALRERGFEVGELHDAEATGANIRIAIAGALARGRRGDTVVVVNSSHGSRVRDVSGDEPDRFDEVICPHDVFTAGPIVDDEIGVMLRARRYGVHVLFVPDSCFSGTVQRAVGDDRVTRGGTARFLPPAEFAQALANNPRPVVSARGKALAVPVLLAACREDQVAYEAQIGGRRNGAFTRAALDTLRSQPRNYRTWLQQIRRRLTAGGFDQEPQLMGAAWQQWRRVL